MNAVRMELCCADVLRFADAFVDGEFGAEERAELERHLAACPECAREVRLHAAFKAALQAAAPHPSVPAPLRARLLVALDEVRPGEPAGWSRAAWRAVPVAAAAALLVALAIQHTHSSAVADAAIETFRRDPPLDVTGPADAVRAYFHQRVNFVVRPPQLPDAALLGARLANIRERQAAYLVYDVRGSRVSVFVFDPTDVPIEARHRREVGGRNVYLDGDRGYSVALLRDRGVGYVFASDLDEDQMVRLVSSAINH